MFVTLFFLPSFDYPFHFMAPFLAMAELKQALFLLIWLNENVPFHGTFSSMQRYMFFSRNAKGC